MLDEHGEISASALVVSVGQMQEHNRGDPRSDVTSDQRQTLQPDQSVIDLLTGARTVTLSMSEILRLAVNNATLRRLPHGMALLLRTIKPFCLQWSLHNADLSVLAVL